MEIQEQPPVASERGIFLPFIALALSVAVVLYGMYSVSRQQRSLFKRSLQQREQVVVEARNAQGNLERMARDVLALSARDADARAIVAKYQIREQPGVPPPAK